MSTDSPVSTFLAKRRQELEEKILNKHEKSKAFIPIGDLRIILKEKRLHKLFKILRPESLSDDDLNNMFERVWGGTGDNEFAGLLRIISTLVYLQDQKNLEKLIDRLSASPKDEDLPTDDDLPFNSHRAQRLFGSTEGHRFQESQGLFCALILRKDEDPIFDGSKADCPLPFIGSPEKIHEGASGTVYSITVAPGHWKSTGMSNDEPRKLAQKVFHNAEHFEAEKDKLRRLKNSRMRHQNVMLDLGSIVIDGKDGTQCSLLYPLAQENLETFLHATNESSQGKITDMAEKEEIVKRTSDLAGGLDWFHNAELSLSLYHFDIKPSNILVDITEQGEIAWKLTDFDLACAKEREPPRLGRIDDGKIAREAEHSSAPSARCAGTFQAPEVREEGDKTGKESDIWSFGCVVLLIFVYLDGGIPAVDSFNEDRVRYDATEDADVDYFYTIKSGGKVILYPEVTKWMTRLQHNAQKRSKKEGECVENAMKYLQEKVLLIDRKQRSKTSAENLQEKLDAVSYHYTKEPELEQPSRSTSSCTKLCEAIQQSDVKAVEGLLKQERDINALCLQCKMAPLHLIVRQNHDESKIAMFEHFLQLEEIDVNVEDGEAGRTPFKLACEEDGDYLSVRALLTHEETRVEWGSLNKDRLTSDVWKLIDHTTRGTPRERPRRPLTRLIGHWIGSIWSKF